MPTPKKLPSGAWRIQAFYKDPVTGKVSRPSFTAETKAEVLMQYAEFLQDHKERRIPLQQLTVGQAVDRYIAMSEPTLSPTTISAYRKYRRHAFQDLMDRPASKLSDAIMQDAINEEIRRLGDHTGRSLSGKTIRNEYGLISAALRSVCHLAFNVKLPKTQLKPIELPEPETVAKAIKGSPIELPCLLAIWLSFSMSEIRGLKCSSVRNGRLYVDQTRVLVDGVEIEKKDAKVQTRNRFAKIPPRIMDLIKNLPQWKEYKETGKDAFLVNETQNSIYLKFTKVCEENGFSLTFHGLRHMHASILLNMLGAPRKIVQEKGGWNTDYVMGRNYDNTFHSVRERVDAEMDDYMEAILK